MLIILTEIYYFKDTHGSFRKVLPKLLSGSVDSRKICLVG